MKRAKVKTAAPALEEPRYGKLAQGLAAKQFDNGKNVQGAIDDIRALPKGDEKFPKELMLLTAVTNAMADADRLLEKPETGDPTIAAETEAIELLLQAKRQKPNGGGGGGSTPGGGGKAASASSAALADIGPGSDVNSQQNARPVGQSTGHAGREFPEEFRTGLDSYFNALEGQGGSK